MAAQTQAVVTADQLLGTAITAEEVVAQEDRRAIQGDEAEDIATTGVTHPPGNSDLAEAEFLLRTGDDSWR